MRGHILEKKFMKLLIYLISQSLKKWSYFLLLNNCLFCTNSPSSRGMGHERRVINVEEEVETAVGGREKTKGLWQLGRRAFGAERPQSLASSAPKPLSSNCSNPLEYKFMKAGVLFAAVVLAYRTLSKINKVLQYLLNEWNISVHITGHNLFTVVHSETTPIWDKATMENFMKDKKRDSLLNYSDKHQRNITAKGSITIKHPMPPR